MSDRTDRISELCRQTDLLLWDAYGRARYPERGGPRVGSLVFPEYRGGSLRVSEQEARFAFVESLARGAFRYAVEAPTSKSYQFTGKKGLSAQTDLALYGAGGRTCNVEFKAKGLRPSERGRFPIYKDLQKLLREPVPGLWFHLLESVDNSTIRGLTKVLADEMSRVEGDFANDLDCPELILHVCVLHHGFSVEQTIPLPAARSGSRIDWRAHLEFDYKVSRTELLEVRHEGGWSVFRRVGLTGGMDGGPEEA